MRRAKKIIHVNRQNIAMNIRDHQDRPVFTMKEGRKTIYARRIKILGPCDLVQGEPLSCGARAWIETTSDVELTDPMTFRETRENFGKPKGEMWSAV